MAYAMGYERNVKLFKNGRSQAVRIPREFELPGTEVLMRREGDSLVLRPVAKLTLLELLHTFETLDEDFGVIEDLPAEPINL